MSFCFIWNSLTQLCWVAWFLLGWDFLIVRVRTQFFILAKIVVSDSEIYLTLALLISFIKSNSSYNYYPWSATLAWQLIKYKREHRRLYGRHPTNFTGTSSECSPGMGWWGHRGWQLQCWRMAGFILAAGLCMSEGSWESREYAIGLLSSVCRLFLFDIIMSLITATQPLAAWSEGELFSSVEKLQNVHV